MKKSHWLFFYEWRTCRDSSAHPEYSSLSSSSCRCLIHYHRWFQSRIHTEQIQLDFTCISTVAQTKLGRAGPRSGAATVAIKNVRILDTWYLRHHFSWQFRWNLLTPSSHIYNNGEGGIFKVSEKFLVLNRSQYIVWEHSTMADPVFPKWGGGGANS